MVVDRVAPIEDRAEHIALARLAAGLAQPGRPLADDAAAPMLADMEKLPAFLRRNKLPLLSLWAMRGSPERSTELTAETQRSQSQTMNQPLRPLRLCGRQPSSAWPAPFLDALHAEEGTFAALRAEYELLRTAWQEEGIEGLFLKSVGLPPAFPHASDNLDVYIPPAQGGAARQILRRLGYVELRHLEEPNKYLFKRFCAGHEVCAIHMHLRLEWSVSFLHEAQVWARRRIAADDARLLIPAPEDALLITLAHALYENKALKLGDVARVNHCLGVAGLDWDYVWEMARSKGWGAGLAIALLLHDRLDRWLYASPALPAVQAERAWSLLGAGRRQTVETLLARPAQLPFPISFLLSKRLFFEKMLRDENEPLGRRLQDVGTHLVTGTRLKLHLRHQPAMLVTVSGPEGSGKSTQAHAIESAFRECHELRVRYAWSRGGASSLAAGLIRLGKRLMGRAPAAESRLAAEASAAMESRPTEQVGEEAREAEREALFRRPLARRLWPWLILLDASWTYLRQVRWPLWQGQIVICDRYVPDTLAELGARLGVVEVDASLAGRLLRWLNPRPGRSWYLDVPAGDARQRQPAEIRQGTLELAERQTAVYNRLIERRLLDPVDATRPAEVIADRLVYETLTDYFDGYATLINALLLSNPKPISHQPSALGAQPKTKDASPPPDG